MITGYLENKQFTTSVEKFSIQSQKMEACSACLYPANSPACCAFNDRYIYKFGGNQDDGTIVSAIERYDTYNNRWTMIDPQFDLPDQQRFTMIY